MREDVVEASVEIGHPPDVVWRIVGAPDWYSRFVPGISGFDMLARAGQQVVGRADPETGSGVSLERRPRAGGGTALWVRMTPPPSQADLLSPLRRETPGLAPRLGRPPPGPPAPKDPHAQPRPPRRR